MLCFLLEGASALARKWEKIVETACKALLAVAATISAISQLIAALKQGGAKMDMDNFERGRGLVARIIFYLAGALSLLARAIRFLRAAL